MRAFISFTMLIAFLATFALAQEPAALEPISEPAAPVYEQPAALEPQSEEPVASVQEESAASEQPLESATPVQEEAVASEPVAEPAPEPEPAPAPVVQQVIPEPAPAPAAYVQEYVAPEPQKPAVKVEQASAEDFHFGVRAAFGISALRGHKAVRVSSENLNQGDYAIKLGSAVSAGIGLVFACDINELFSIAPELNYTLYRANGNFKVKTGEYLRDLNFADLELHSLELPILAHFNLGLAYAEVGPQVGFNFSSKVNENYNLKSPDLKAFAFGPTLGGGVNIDGFLLGIRGHFGLLEYAKNTKGYPWAVHASATKLFF